MNILKAAVGYFLLVFAAGFALGIIRVLLLVPRVGMRIAELLEMPVMLVVIVWSARWVLRRWPPPAAAARLAVGLIALGLLLVAEFLLAWLLQGQSPAQAIAGRDPVSGSVYLAMLAVFAAMPLVLGRSGRTSP